MCDTDKSPPEWRLDFERGVSTFPLPQQKIYLTPKSELSFVYGQGVDASLEIGEHVGAAGTPAYADLNELLGKHTAILGSTGAGKSGAVAAILHAIRDRGVQNNYAKWNPRIIILDPHNEYGTAFPEHARLSTDEETLSLPYWLLDFDETIALLIGKTEIRGHIPDEYRQETLSSRHVSMARRGLVFPPTTLQWTRRCHTFWATRRV